MEPPSPRVIPGRQGEAITEVSNLRAHRSRPQRGPAGTPRACSSPHIDMRAQPEGRSVMPDLFVKRRDDVANIAVNMWGGLGRAAARPHSWVSTNHLKTAQPSKTTVKATPPSQPPTPVSTHQLRRRKARCSRRALPRAKRPRTQVAG